MNIADLPFVQQMQVHEANVRGVYISIACDYERLMDDLIILCELDKASSIKEYKRRYITHLEMGKKLDRCKKGLKNYNAFYAASFAIHFEIISELVHYRNILAHGYSDYDDNQMDKSFIEFSYLKKGKQRNEKIEIRPFLMKMDKYRNSIMELAGLVVLIRKENNLL